MNAIEQFLGAGHPIPRTVQAAVINPNSARNAWNAIANLLDKQPRTIAEIFSETMILGF